MTINKIRICPDLLYYTNSFVLSSVANKFKIQFSPTFLDSYLSENKSFIRLLFDKNWNHNNYRYLFREEINKSNIPSDLLRRMMIYPTSKYYVCDSDNPEICNINLFNLQNDDKMMLDKLLQYRIDTTSTSIEINYDDLSTKLSKLIYIYLNFKINNDYSLVDQNPISNEEEILENFYEALISDTIFNYISNLGK